MCAYKVRPVTTADYQQLAKKRLPRFFYDYVAGGANEEQSLRANEKDLRSICLRQRVMRDVSHVDTSTVVNGRQIAMPLVMAPVGLGGMMARRAEVQAARAGSQVGIPFTLSTVGICGLEEVQKAVSDPLWFQLYMVRDRGLVESLLQRAQSVGCNTLMFTVDLAVSGKRHRDTRGGMIGQGARYNLSKAWQIASHPRWVFDVGLRGRPHTFGNLSSMLKDSKNLNEYKDYVGSQFDQAVTWKDIEWLRSKWDGQILVKGVMTAQDAIAARDVGADGVIVSNHGGRQLDGVSSTIRKLPEVVAAVGKQLDAFLAHL